MNKLYIFCGIPFSGKTTIAKKISDKFGFSRIDLDDVKFGLFGNDVKDENLSQKDWDKVYATMYEKIGSELRNGKTVIQDTGNFTAKERLLVKNIAKDIKLETIEVYINTPVEVARKRLVKNRETKDRFNIRDEDFESTIAEMETPKEAIIYNYPESVDDWIDKNFDNKSNS